MAVVQRVGNGRRNWVKETEHVVFRLVSLILSAASAYAVRWFFEPLDVGDPVHYVLWWLVAIGFGLLGFYLSRGIAYRMMNAVVDMDMVRRREAEAGATGQRVQTAVAAGTRVQPVPNGGARPGGAMNGRPVAAAPVQPMQNGRPVVAPVQSVQNEAARSNGANGGRSVVAQAAAGGGPGAVETERDMSPLKNYYAQRRAQQDGEGVPTTLV
jgi:hypothetical protein